jgi:hypothetical protein
MRDRRRFLASLAFVSGIAAAGRNAMPQQADKLAQAMPGMSPGTMTAGVCIESCWRSHVMCLETERYCLEKGGVHVMPAHLALLADCAEMCQKTANSLLRRSPQHAVICIACAQLCDACAEQCEAIKDDERMSRCARTCRECATHCRDMSKIAI